jgi:hypothetical protein
LIFPKTGNPFVAPNTRLGFTPCCDNVPPLSVVVLARGSCDAQEKPVGIDFFVACWWLASVLSSYVLGRHLERGTTDNIWLELTGIVFPIIVGLWMTYKRVSNVPE